MYREHQEEAGRSYSFGKEALDVDHAAVSRVHRPADPNAVSPGAVQTPMIDAIASAFPVEMTHAVTHPIGRRSTSAEQIGPILFLGTDAASCGNGIDLQVDSGYWAARSVAGQLN